MMDDNIIEHTRVLSIDPTSKGFGYAVLEAPERLVDWGVKEVRDNKEVRCIAQASGLIHRYRPDAVVVEDFNGDGSRRCPRVQGLIKEIECLASDIKVKTGSFSRSEIREAFSEADASTKHEIATAIAKRFPELSLRLPPARKCYMPEDYRMAIFDAVSLALTFYYFKEQRRGLMQKFTKTNPIKTSNAKSQKSKNPCHRPWHKGDGGSLIGGGKADTSRGQGNQKEKVSP